MKSYLMGALALALVGCGPSGSANGGGPISVDSPQNGSIGFATTVSTIPNRTGTFPRDLWTVSLTAGTAYTFLMCKTGVVTIDPYLSVTPPTGVTEEAHFNDDAAGNLNSRLVFTPTATGTYTIYASVYAPIASGGDSGTYRLSVLTGAMDSVTCPAP